MNGEEMDREEVEKGTHQMTMNAAPIAIEISKPRAVPAQTYLKIVEEIMPNGQQLRIKKKRCVRYVYKGCKVPLLEHLTSP